MSKRNSSNKAPKARPFIPAALNHRTVSAFITTDEHAQFTAIAHAKGLKVSQLLYAFIRRTIRRSGRVESPPIAELGATSEDADRFIAEIET